jgi:hypothetical protein
VSSHNRVVSSDGAFARYSADDLLEAGPNPRFEAFDIVATSSRWLK